MGKLWEKEKDGSAYTNVLKINHESIKHLEEAFPIAKKKDSGRVKQKSNPRAKMARFDGNRKVVVEEWHEAMQLYNKCLCNAEPYSENISMAYANRSLCFLKLGMYKKCLKDIKLAIDNNYPDRLRPKLMSRRAYCLNKLKEETPFEEEEAKLDFPEHEFFPGMANVLTIENNPEYGRHVVATSDIDVGKVVLVEKAYVTTAVMTTEKMLCSYCFKGMMNFVACNHCNISMFCDEDCYQRDELHEVSCGKQIDKIDHLVMFTARSIVAALNSFRTFDALVEFVESVVKNKDKEAPSSLADDVSKYRAFLQCGVYLNKEEKKKLQELANNQLYTHVMAIEEIKEKTSDNEERERFLQHLMLQHLYIIKSNSFQNKDSGGIFLAQRHFNHSCAPNLLQYFRENKTICFTTRKIKKGDQLFITYGNEDFWEEPKFIRQELLEKVFNFKCKCVKCLYDNSKTSPIPHFDVSSKHVKLDPEYLCLCYEMKHYEYDDEKQCAIFKEKCLSLLKKYGNMHEWNIELDDVCQKLIKLLNQPYRDAKKDEKDKDKKDEK